jgi:hypothetical protein
MIQLFYVEVTDKLDSSVITNHLYNRGFHFVTQDPAPGTLDEVEQLIKESNVPATNVRRY